MDMNFYNKHYITVDEQNRIVNGFSDAFRQPTETDICINDQGGYQFRLFPGGEENPPLYEFEHMVPLYKWEAARWSPYLPPQREHNRLLFLVLQANCRDEAQLASTVMIQSGLVLIYKEDILCLI